MKNETRVLIHGTLEPGVVTLELLQFIGGRTS